MENNAWLWVIIGVIALVAVIWASNYWYNYHTEGICTDERGNPYICGKAYRYSSDTHTNYNVLSYSYYDNYGNKVAIDRTYNYDDYYDCYHARTPDSRYGQLLRDKGIMCRGNDASSYNDVQYASDYNYYSGAYYSSSEKAPLI